MKNLEIKEEIISRDGPFDEFKQDVSFVSVELLDGQIFHGVVLLYPNTIISMRGMPKPPFDADNIVRVFQTKDDLLLSTDASYVYWCDFSGVNNEESILSKLAAGFSGVLLAVIFILLINEYIKISKLNVFLRVIVFLPVGIFPILFMGITALWITRNKTIEAKPTVGLNEDKKSSPIIKRI